MSQCGCWCLQQAQDYHLADWGHSNFAEVITGLGGTTQGREGSRLLTKFDPRTFAAQEQPSVIRVEGKAQVVLCCWKNVGLEGR